MRISKIIVLVIGVNSITSHAFSSCFNPHGFASAQTQEENDEEERKKACANALSGLYLGQIRQDIMYEETALKYCAKNLPEDQGCPEALEQVLKKFTRDRTYIDPGKNPRHPEKEWNYGINEQGELYFHHGFYFHRYPEFRALAEWKNNKIEGTQRFGNWLCNLRSYSDFPVVCTMTSRDRD